MSDSEKNTLTHQHLSALEGTRSLTDYRPQHDGNCDWHRCVQCEHQTHFDRCPYMVAVDNGVDSCSCVVHTRRDCTCGLDALLALSRLPAPKMRFCPTCGEDWHVEYCAHSDDWKARLALSRLPADLEMKYRRELWLNHGHHGAALYGDDGEMQCGKCMTLSRLYDYKRAPLADVENAANTARLQRASEAVSRLPADQEEIARHGDTRYQGLVTHLQITIKEQSAEIERLKARLSEPSTSTDDFETRPFASYQMVRIAGEQSESGSPRFHIYGIRPNGLWVGLDKLYLSEMKEADPLSLHGRTLRDYRPQHDFGCKVGVCAQCGHTEAFHFEVLSVLDNPHKFEPCDCTCGLDTLLLSSTPPAKKDEKKDLGGHESHGGRSDLEPAARPQLSHAERNK